MVIFVHFICRFKFFYLLNDWKMSPSEQQVWEMGQKAYQSRAEMKDELWPSPLLHIDYMKKRCQDFWIEKCCAWCFEWASEWVSGGKIKKNKVRKMSLLGKWHYWSCCCEFKLLEVFKDCISYLLYVCVHTAQSGVFRTQRWALASPEVENVLQQQKISGLWRPVGWLGVCVTALCTELYLCIEFFLFSPFFLPLW